MVDDSWEFGFYDSEFPEVMYWAAKGVRFTSIDLARTIAFEHPGIWEMPVFICRRPGAEDWEYYDDVFEPDCT